MFLRNHDNYMTAFQLRGETVWSSTVTYAVSSYFFTATSTSEFQDGQLNIRATDGTITSIYFSSGPSNGSFVANPSALDKQTICLGDGNTAVTYDDYKLSGNVITNNLVKMSRTVTYDTENKKWVVKLVCSYENTGTSDIVISEWGIFQPNLTKGSSYSAFENNSLYYVLMFREVLAEPITIPAGETSTIYFTLDVPMANHP